MIEKPIIKKKDIGLRYTENGAFDIPTFIPSVAINYFSGKISLKNAKKELIRGGHMIGCESDEEVLSELKRSLKGNERFFTYLDEESGQQEKEKTLSFPPKPVCMA